MPSKKIVEKGFGLDAKLGQKAGQRQAGQANFFKARKTAGNAFYRPLKKSGNENLMQVMKKGSNIELIEQ